MNIDFPTLCLISIPGFVIGLMTGRLVAGSQWQSIKNSLGVLGRFLSTATFIAYLGASVITLSIMIIYMANLPDTARPTNFWVTFALAFWIALNLVLDMRGVLRRRRNVEPS